MFCHFSKAWGWLERTISQRIVDRVGLKGVGGLPEQREKVPWKDMTVERLWRTCSPLWRSHHFRDMLERESARAGVVQEWLPLSRRHLGLDGPWAVVREVMLDEGLQAQLQVSRLQVKGGCPGAGGRGEGVNASLVLEWRGPRSGWAGLGKVRPSRKVKGKVLSSKGTSP